VTVPVGVVLAGGRGSRLGGRAKADVPVAGRPMLAYVLEALTAVLDEVAVAAKASTALPGKRTGGGGATGGEAAGDRAALTRRGPGGPGRAPTLSSPGGSGGAPTLSSPRGPGGAPTLRSSGGSGGAPALRSSGGSGGAKAPAVRARGASGGAPSLGPPGGSGDAQAPTLRVPGLPDPVALWIEPDEPRHSLAGLRQALARAGGRPVLACAVDLPLITPALVAEVAGADAEGTPAVVPRAGGRLQPLLARYEPEALDALGPAGDDQSLIEAVYALRPRVIEPADPDVFFNVNSAADVEHAAAELRRRHRVVRGAG
jgi:molybdenum cofactor guanylyltransferase